MYISERETTILPKRNSEETLDFLKNVEAEWNKKRPCFYEFAMLYQERHVGAVSVYFENGIGELGWIVNKQYWGKGFAYEAAKAVIQYFAANMGTTHFIAHCDTDNIASYKIMEKLGMIRTGKNGGRKNRAAAMRRRGLLINSSRLNIALPFSKSGGWISVLSRCGRST